MSAYLIEVYDSKDGVIYPKIIGPFDDANTEDTQNLSQPKKIDLLSSALQLAAPGARISYTEEAKRVIDDIVSVVNEDVERTLSIASPAQTA